MKILEQFDSKKNNFEKFKTKLEILIVELLNLDNIRSHQVTSRVKDKDSLKKKVSLKNYKYDDISDVTDCIGVRIITYLEDEVDKVAELIEREFKIDYENSVDKRKLDIDRFGYKSLHYVVSLSDSRKELKEYSNYHDFKAEIQIRSILQHSWAEIEHDIGYKSAITVPDIVRRDFYRVAALLEIADIEFVKIKNTLDSYNQQVNSELEESPEKFGLNKNTIEAFIEKSNLVKEMNLSFIKETNIPISEGYGELDQALEIFRKYRINSIEQLRIKIHEYSKIIISYEKEYLLNYKEIITAIGAATVIHDLADILVLENNDKSFDRFDEFLSFEDAMAIYKKINNS